MGALAETVTNPAELGAGLPARQGSRPRPTVIVMQVDPYEGWTTEGHAWWEIGTPEVSDSAEVRAKHAEVEAGRASQRRASDGRPCAPWRQPFLVIGRAGMDLYADPPGTRIEEATQFTAALGGSSANIAVALTRQGAGRRC